MLRIGPKMALWGFRPLGTRIRTQFSLLMYPNTHYGYYGYPKKYPNTQNMKHSRNRTKIGSLGFSTTGNSNPDSVFTFDVPKYPLWVLWIPKYPKLATYTESHQNQLSGVLDHWELESDLGFHFPCTQIPTMGTMDTQIPKTGNIHRSAPKSTLWGSQPLGTRIRPRFLLSMYPNAHYGY